MQKLIEQLKNSWYLLAFLVLVSIWYADTNSRIATVEAKSVKQEDALTLILDKLNKLSTDSAVNTEKLTDISEDFKEIKQEIKKND